MPFVHFPPPSRRYLYIRKPASRLSVFLSLFSASAFVPVLGLAFTFTFTSIITITSIININNKNNKNKKDNEKDKNDKSRHTVRDYCQLLVPTTTVSFSPAHAPVYAADPLCQPADCSSSSSSSCTRSSSAMDHLASRFRRSRRGSPIPQTARDSQPASPTTPADVKPALPSLTITTATLTTPPTSSHSSHALLPRSPLRGFNHFRPVKRARSPPSAQGHVSGTRPSLSPVDTSPETPTTPATHLGNGKAKTPQLPPFLASSPAGT